MLNNKCRDAGFGDPYIDINFATGFNADGVIEDLETNGEYEI